jgi:Ca-activated chloride channel homolog
MKSNFFLLAVLLLAMIMSFKELRTITGKVTDNNGQPIAGVSVLLKGTSQSTITDINGTYSISINKGSGTLVFSFIGYITAEEKIGTGNVLNVVMSEDVTSLNEVVVNALGIERKMESESVYEPASSVSGRVAGVSVRGKHSGKATASPVSGNINFNNWSSNDYNTESYAAVTENGFKSVKKDPLSTFSIDVDNASYTNIRRFINQGQLPPPDAVRIEEMVNYFKYSYPEPSGEHPFSVSAELAVCPWEKKHLLMQVGLKGKDINKASLPPSNIVFLIDVSGSMDDPNKLPLLKSGLGLLVRELRPIDHIAIVVYAGSAGLVLESTPGNRKEAILRAIDNLQAGGSTAGGAGLKLAYSEAGENYIEGGNNRIILATDGDFNVGESGNDAMERLVEQKRKNGIFITVLGFGMGNIKDDKMEIIADKGNGNYSYIDNLQEARRVLVREFGGTLFTIAKDVKLQLEFNPARIKAYRLIGYENRLLAAEDFNNDRKDAGEMGAGHTVTALYELIPSGSDETVPSVDPLKYGSFHEKEKMRSDYPDEDLTIKVRYKLPEGSSSTLLTQAVSGPVSTINNSSANLRFAAAVAEFGMILRNSEFTGQASLESAAALARSARGEDEEGYRSEFIRLVKTVQDMMSLSDK